MTLVEAGRKYSVPMNTLKRYIAWGFIRPQGPEEYRDEDFERLGLVDALLNAGFSPMETNRYLMLDGRRAAAEEQMVMLNAKRKALLDEIHQKQQALDHLDFIIWDKRKPGKKC
ncbi:MAG TPA: hypothetical protein IAA59_00275 [Candidatus Faecaligallichristensenella faecipullorum]|nr:hypothetical protein [Candidatus Faecaligallichristensenella faecipullorum]